MPGCLFAILIEFGDNSLGLQRVQVTLEIFEEDTTDAEAFLAALRYSNTERCADIDRGHAAPGVPEPRARCHRAAEPVTSPRTDTRWFGGSDAERGEHQARSASRPEDRSRSGRWQGPQGAMGSFRISPDL